MKKEKILLKQGQKVIYWAPYIKPSITQVEELVNDEVAILENRIRINNHLNKKGYFTRSDRKEGFALPYSEENLKIVEAANFYHQLDLSPIQAKLKQAYEDILNPEATNKILQVKRLINKINKALE